MIPTPTYEFKLVLVGDSSVGKSSIINRFVDDTFTQSLLSTIGVDFKFRKIVIDNKEVKLQIWDTAGQQVFRSIISAYYSSADAIIVIYDVTDSKSCQNVKSYWLKEIENQNRNNAKVFGIGNKIDLKEKRQVDVSVLESFDTTKNYQVSAKENIGVQQAFIDISKILMVENKSTKKAKQANTVIKSNQKQEENIENSNKMCCSK